MRILLLILLPFTLFSQRRIEVYNPPPVNLFIMSGESNSGGQALNADATVAELAVRLGTKILNNTTRLFESLDIGVNNLIGHQNMSTPTLRHSWELQIANSVDSGYFTRQAYIVKTGQGGSKIQNWMPDSSYQTIQPWTVFQSRVDSALTLIGKRNRVNIYILYSQGINDAISGYNSSDWLSRTVAHFQKIRTKYGPVPIVMTKLFSQVGTNYTSINSNIDIIKTIVPEVYSVDTQGIDRDDQYHWSYIGQKEVFRRMLVVLQLNYIL